MVEVRSNSRYSRRISCESETIGVGQRGADDLAGRALVIGIDVGVQEAYRDRLDAFGFRAPRDAFDAVAIERLLAPRPTPARARRTSTCESPRHQRAMTMEEKVVGFGPVAAADDVDVARAVGDDQRRSWRRCARSAC